ncbi:MAG: hypothetical protein SFY95_00670 [Planctomycetota bacterium]|nr:hypothetical protein [Planctomycetota bacterium]
MKNVIALAALAAVAGSAQSAVVAYWAFPTSAPSQNFNLAWPFNADVKANAGLAILDTDAPKYDGSPAPNAIQQGSMQLLTGSIVNAQPGFAAGQGLGLRNDSQNRGEGKSIFLRFDATNFLDLSLSYAERYSSTGPTTVTIGYSTDGVSFTDFTSYSTLRDGNFAAAARVIDLSSVNSIENRSASFLRIRFSGFNVNSNGAARLDNITVSGTVIPTPGAAALLGLAGLAATRRRR